jgi:hypothetical protein
LFSWIAWIKTSGFCWLVESELLAFEKLERKSILEILSLSSVALLYVLSTFSGHVFYSVNLVWTTEKFKGAAVNSVF